MASIRVIRAQVRLNFSLLLLCALISLTLATASDARSASTALKDLRRQYKALTGLQASFTESFEWAMTGEKVERTGTLIVAANNRFKMETTELVMACDGQMVYRHNRPRNQFIIEPVARDKEKLLPNRLLLEFSDEFDPVAVSELTVEGAPGYRLDLKAKKPDETLLTEAVLWVTSSDNLVRRLKFKDLSGNTTTFSLTDIRINQPAAEGAFILSTPEGAEVFDLR